MNIITVTLSPATDIYLTADSLRLYKENHLSSLGRYCGGKGINISRALASYDIKSTAIVVMPREGEEEYKRALTSEGIDYLPFLTSGSVRENITIHSKENGKVKETRLSIDAAPIDKDVIKSVIERLISLCDSTSIVVISGSLPKGVYKDELLPFFHFAEKQGVRVILDSRSYTLSDIAKAKPCLIKPNAEECEGYVGFEPRSTTDGIKAVKLLREKTGANVLLSLGEGGAVLLYGDEIYEAKAPKIETISTIGAGDSMIAGFVYAMSEGLPCCECLKYALAYGSAKCLKEGTLPPEKADIKALYNKIKIKKSEDLLK